VTAVPDSPSLNHRDRRAENGSRLAGANVHAASRNRLLGSHSLPIGREPRGRQVPKRGGGTRIATVCGGGARLPLVGRLRAWRQENPEGRRRQANPPGEGSLGQSAKLTPDLSATLRPLAIQRRVVVSPRREVGGSNRPPSPPTQTAKRRSSRPSVNRSRAMRSAAKAYAVSQRSPTARSLTHMR
jgi:hypothetical protein